MNNIREKVYLDLKEIKRKKESYKKYSSSFKSAFSIILPSLILIIIFQFFIGIARVKGSSMNNTLYEGDFVLFNRLPHNYKYEDVIVAKKSDENKFIIKRIIGLPNDTIDIKDGYVILNGVKISENKYTLDGTTQLQNRTFPITLSENEYFLLGDNRALSLDSRSIETGNIKKNQILGKVFFISRLFK